MRIKPLYAFAAIGASIVAADYTTSGSEIKDIEVLRLSGPVLYDIQWTVETNQGPVQMPGGTAYLKDDNLSYGGDIVRAMPSGTKYCAEIKTPGIVTGTLRHIFAADIPDVTPKRFGTIQRKTDGIDCDTLA